MNTGQETIVIAHADYPDNEYQFGKEVPLFNVVWARERISDSMDDIGGEISGADRFIFGHTPVKSRRHSGISSISTLVPYFAET
ncbi:hypothetical protein [Escherichia coli]|uniref:hypothetical protein n=1 Tax=Escherichia coli TaxID=562 RepID=UPI0023BA0651|nr:hypothetical protein [Escherichia coli]